MITDISNWSDLGVIGKGGQAVVHHYCNDHGEYAVKFFKDRRDCDNEWSSFDLLKSSNFIIKAIDFGFKYFDGKENTFIIYGKYNYI
jgi:hypothetical protein